MTDPLAVCLDGFRASAFRLEGLPSYSDGLTAPLRSVRSNGYLRRITRAALNGQPWTHVRVVDDPPTPYQRGQLTRGLIELHACGADVYVIERAALRVDLLDFWLFDARRPDARAVLLHYTDDGGALPEADELITDRGHLDDLAGIAEDLVGLSLPLDDYLGAMRA